MKNSEKLNLDQEQIGSRHDPETGEIISDSVAGNDGDAEAVARELYGSDAEGPQPDGSTILPKMTMATIRANPERVKLIDPPRPLKMALVTGMVGSEFLMPAMDQESRMNDLALDDIERMTFTALVATIEPFGAVRYSNDGEPEAVFKSDFLFLPTGHIAVLRRLRQYHQVPIALEFWAQPASNPRGYSWYFHNLAKYDRGISPVDRLLKMGVQAGRALQLDRHNVGLLADLRAR